MAPDDDDDGASSWNALLDSDMPLAGWITSELLAGMGLRGVRDYASRTPGRAWSRDIGERKGNRWVDSTRGGGGVQ